MKIFLSYSTRDNHFVRRLAGDLDRAGIDLWLDERELRAGDDLAAIESAICGSGQLLVVVSLASAGSAWVEREIQVAQSLGIRVLPILLEDVPGQWAHRVARLAPADFRRPREYRRATHRLIAAIEDRPSRDVFLRGKEAVAKVRAEHSPIGDLFGISQQGVANLYSLTNLRDWEFADVTDGTGRFWVTEFYDPRTARIQTYAVVDGTVHELPELYQYGADLVAGPDSVVTYACALNHLPTLSEADAATIVAEHRDSMRTIGRRYTPFRPVPLTQEFVDSTVAVPAAVKSAFGTSGPPAELFALARLERDKRNRDLPTWTVAFFDPTLTESVRAVGVDAATGAVRSNRTRAEILNAAFMTSRFDMATGNIVFNAANQLRAMENHVWDIPVSQPVATGLSAADALTMAEEHLRARPNPRPWQLGFLSTTGVMATVTGPAESPTARLMARNGTAGQWVVEVFGPEPTEVRDGTRVGYAYPFRQLLCTRAGGAVPAGSRDTLVLTSPLSRAPLPERLLEAYENARTIAIDSAGVDFVAMSVVLRRSPPGADWYFRFYDAADIIATVAVSGDGRRLVT